MYISCRVLPRACASRLILSYVNFVIQLISSSWPMILNATSYDLWHLFLFSFTLHNLIHSVAHWLLDNIQRFIQILNKTVKTYPYERGRWSGFHTCSEESHRFGLQSEHSCSSSSCLWLVTRRNEISIAVFVYLLSRFFLLRYTDFGCSRNFVSCPRSFCSVHSIASFSRVLFFRIISPSFSWSLSFTFDQIAPLWTENMWLEVVMLVHTAIYHVQTHPPNTTAISNSLKYPKKNHTITAHQ